MSALWYNADQQNASPARSSHSASDRWHDAFSDIASATCSSSVPDCSAFLQEGKSQSLRALRPWRIASKHCPGNALQRRFR